MKGEILKDIIEKVKTASVSNVGIFVDFDNVYYGLKDLGVDLKDDNYCVFQLMNTIYGKDTIRTMRAYADFDQVTDISFKMLQEKRVQIRNVYGNGKEEQYRKNASDIELSIDAMETYYKNSNIDTYVFITADSDMIPIMSRLVYKGKKVHLFYLGNNTSQYQRITDYADINCDLVKLFELSLERKEASYWKSQALQSITDWYADEKNGGKTLGGKWLNDLFKEKLHISSTIASKIISYLTDNSLISQDDNRAYRIK